MADDIMPIVVIGGVAVVAYYLIQQQQQQQQSAPVAPVSGASAPCMGVDPIGNPCACPTPSSVSGMTLTGMQGHIVGRRNCHRCRTVYPNGCFSCRTAQGGWAFCNDCMISCGGDITGESCRKERHGPEKIIGIIPGSVEFIPAQGTSVFPNTGVFPSGSTGSCDCSKCGTGSTSNPFLAQTGYEFY